MGPLSDDTDVAMMATRAARTSPDPALQQVEA